MFVSESKTTYLSSDSDVYYPGDALYAKGISHDSSASTQQSKCVVEPGTAEDVGRILRILSETRTPFAVKGGGHTSNPGFSSTPGVHISMYRFSAITPDSASNTVDLAAGLIWDDVYAYLDRLSLGVIGARSTGVGVAGFLLGGGYSYVTNQYGLGMDNIVAFELVLPNGQVTTVTNASDSELFFGLKGGQNNFGIVTKFTLKTYPQAKVWGGSLLYAASNISAVNVATVAFQAKTDSKAAITMAYAYDPPTQEASIILDFFYDAPTPPDGLFNEFLAIPAIKSTNFGTVDFLTFFLTVPTNTTNERRRFSAGMPVISFTPEMSDVLVNETMFWEKTLTDKGATRLRYIVEIYQPTIYDHNPDKTAYPPIRNVPFQPWSIAYTWSSAKFDADFHDAAVSSATHVRQAAIAQGQMDAKKVPVYPNHAIYDTPLEDMYGSNLPALRALKARVDPTNVMDLAGGFKFKL